MDKRAMLIGPAERRVRKVSDEELSGKNEGNTRVDRNKLTAFVYENEPIRMNRNNIDDFIDRCVSAGASDISIMSDSSPRVEILGTYYRATRRLWTTPEVDEIMAEIYNSNNARTEINSLKELDFAYEMVLKNGERQRFRVNITGCLADSPNGVEIAMRVLPRVTPSKKSVALEDEVILPMMPRDGLVVIAGGTGHGKSTTMAAVIREHLISNEKPVKITDIQHPIEYTFRDVLKSNKDSSSFMVQMGVGVNISSFDAGVRASLRKKPNIISVGEARDSETISASIEGSLTGHLVYTTTHASSVGETVQRLLSRFSAGERDAKAIDLCSSLRFILVQALVERSDIQGRIPIREYLRITERIRENLARKPATEWPQYLTDEVNGKIEGANDEDVRRAMKDSAISAYQEGKISKANALALSRQISWSD